MLKRTAAITLPAPTQPVQGPLSSQEATAAQTQSNTSSFVLADRTVNRLPVQGSWTKRIRRMHFTSAPCYDQGRRRKKGEVTGL